MSLNCYFLLFNRSRFESEVNQLVEGVLQGRVSPAIEVLKQNREAVATLLDVPPQTYFQGKVRFAIDVLEGRVRTAFVNELSPLITEELEAWEYNVNTAVRGALALSICTEQPRPDVVPILNLSAGDCSLVGTASATACEVAELDNDELLESATVGIFQAPEAYLRNKAIQLIIGELKTLVKGGKQQPCTDRTLRIAGQMYELAAASIEQPSICILRGYL